MSAAPGWYPGPNGVQQYWDGNEWVGGAGDARPQPSDNPHARGPATGAQNVPMHESKSLAVAYLLLVLTGWLGMHRFYLGRHLTGVAIVALGGAGLFLAATLVAFVPGILMFSAMWGWLLADLFLLPGLTRRANGVTF